jgi:hypothetical protein
MDTADSPSCVALFLIVPLITWAFSPADIIRKGINKNSLVTFIPLEFGL